jgi:thymidylate synthase
MDLTLPVVHIEAENLPEGWERAVLETWQRGAPIETQYDQEGDPPSRDALAVIVVRDPFAEPRIHKAIPCGLVELETYRREVVDGIHDHWIDPEAGKWEYTYHERLFDFSVPGLAEPIDQMDYVVDALVEAPHTRRAQAITWKPWEDAGIGDPACLQRMWFRIFGDVLVMNIHMRSNDAFKAAFMNMYGFTDLQRVVAERVSERLGRSIRPGQYTHVADSFHIYGSYFEDFERFLTTLEKRSFEERTYRTEDIKDILTEAQEQIAASLAKEPATGRKGL